MSGSRLGAISLLPFHLQLRFSPTFFSISSSTSLLRNSVAFSSSSSSASSRLNSTTRRGASLRFEAADIGDDEVKREWVRLFPLPPSSQDSVLTPLLPFSARCAESSSNDRSQRRRRRRRLGSSAKKGATTIYSSILSSPTRSRSFGRSRREQASNFPYRLCCAASSCSHVLRFTSPPSPLGRSIRWSLRDGFELTESFGRLSPRAKDEGKKERASIHVSREATATRTKENRRNNQEGFVDSSSLRMQMSRGWWVSLTEEKGGLSKE